MIRKLTTVGSAAALIMAGAEALADEPAAAEKSAEIGIASVLGAAKPLSEDELGEQRATAKLELEEVTINSSDQDGLVLGNAAIGNRTGQNMISGDAFVGASGMIHSVQNTGNNVLIQNSTIVNVSVEP